MSLRITDDCINCGACESECPNGAIYEPAVEWRFSDKTSVTGMVSLKNGTEVDSDEAQSPLSKEFYYIVSDKCTECIGFHDDPQCVNACPVDCCIKDEANVETESGLSEKKERLHT